MRSKLLLIGLPVLMVWILIESCQSEKELRYARYYINGKDLYSARCQNCHGPDGKGLGELIPPLTDTLFLKSRKESLACIIKFGLNDRITVAGKVYQEKMPANAALADIEIAALITYITNSFGNKQGLYDVNQAAKDLRACRQ